MTLSLKGSVIIAASLIASGLLTASLIKAKENPETKDTNITDTHASAAFSDEYRRILPTHRSLTPESIDKEPKTVVININILMDSVEPLRSRDAKEPI